MTTTSFPLHGHSPLLFNAPVEGAQCEVFLGLGRTRGDLVRSTAYIDKVAVYHRDGGRSAHLVQDWVDLVEGVRLVIDGVLENIVGVGLSWASSVMMNGHGELGPFRIEAKPRRTRMRVRGGEGKHPLSPWRVAAGRALGGGPKLVVSVSPLELPTIEGPSRAHGGGEGEAGPSRRLERVVL